jgi:hypothetical protein
MGCGSSINGSQGRLHLPTYKPIYFAFDLNRTPTPQLRPMQKTQKEEKNIVSVLGVQGVGKSTGI